MNKEVIIDAISGPRLAYYSKFLGCRGDIDAIGAYLAFQDLSGDFFPLLQMVEVGLRNRINEAAKSHFKSSSWYDFAVFSHKSQGLVLDAKNKALSECGAKYSDDDVVCRLSLGFWVYMLDTPYRDTTKKKNYFWTPNNHQRAFGAAKNAWGQSLSIVAVFDEFQKVLKLRNRLFHHEPIWKKHNCKSMESAVNNIKKEYLFLLRVLEFVSSGERKLIECVGLPARFTDRCNIEQVNGVIRCVGENLTN